MKEVKCDCGHVNPIGTILCESCGKVLEEKKKTRNFSICGMKAVHAARKPIIKR